MGIGKKNNDGGEGLTSDQENELNEAYQDSHIHNNKDILDNATASYTVAEKAKLGSLSSNFLGVYESLSDCETENPNAKAGNFFINDETDTLWYYAINGWVDSGSTSAGDMLKAIYDPQNIAQDSFNREFHTGSQSIDSITDLQDSLDDKQATITGGITKVLTSNFVKSKAIVSDSDGKAVTSDTTSMEIGYLSGAKSSIQDQIDAISTRRDGYTGGEVADGNIGQKVTETAHQSMAVGVTAYSLKTVHPLTAGVWMIYGNVKWDSSDTSTGGWLKACLSKEVDTFTNYNTMQIDKGMNEADCGGPLFPLYLTTTEDTDIYLNLEREFSTFKTYMYLNILAIRIA